MLDNNAISGTVDELDRMIGGKPFLTIAKRDIMELWRRNCGNAAARLGGNILAEIERELSARDIEAWPKVSQSDETVRLFRANTVVGRLARIIAQPNRLDDIELAHAITKLKGLWVYPDEPAA